MMTPVYNVAIDDWKTNGCNIFPYAARRFTSVFPTYNVLEKGYLRSINKYLFSYRFHNVKKHTFQCFHFLTDETNKNLSRTQHQLRKDNSLLSSASSKLDIFLTSLIHKFYTNEVKHLTYCNVVKSGTEVLWQQAKFALKVRKSESNALRVYIKEQLADFTTTATNEEK